MNSQRYNVPFSQTPAPRKKTNPLLWMIPLGLIMAFFIIITPMSCVNIGAGEVGVMFDPLAGGVQPYTMTEGLNVKPFWATIDKFNIKTQEFTHTKEKTKKTDAPPIYTAAKDNLFVDVDITVLARLDAVKAPEIRKTVGVEGYYQSTLIDPQIRSSVRDVIARYDAASIYSTDTRSTVETELGKTITAALEKRGIKVENTLLKGIYPPSNLLASIEQKKQAEQDAQRMEYVLQKEKLEAERKIVEAGGISKANQIISGSLTTEYLKWYWLEKLRDHNDVIYVPIGNDGFPFFKDIDSFLPSVPPKKVPSK